MVALPLLVPGPQADLPLFVDLPFQSLFRGLHIMGGSQAASVANLIDPSKPLTPIGTATYESDCAIMSATAGFSSQIVTSAYDRCTILIVQDPYEPPLLAAPTIPQVPQPGNITNYYSASWNNFNQFLGLQTFRATDGSAGADASIQTMSPSGTVMNPAFVPPAFYYPGPTVIRPRWWRMIFAISNGTKAVLWWGDEGFLQRTEATHVTLTIPAAAARFGAYSSAPNAQQRVALIGETAALADAQVVALAGYFRAAMAYRRVQVADTTRLAVEAFPSARLAVTA